MIDEKSLQDRLTAAAAAQDDLLPRAVSDDLAAGRRRLRRQRLLTGATALVAAGVVAAATVGVGGVLRNASSNEAPTAGQQAQDDVTRARIAAEEAARVQQIQGFDTLMRGLLAKHLDPGSKHLDFSTGPFELDQQIGGHNTFGRVAWKVAGDKGEGVLAIGLSRSEKSAGNECGDYHQWPAGTCRAVKLPNGRQIMIGHQGKATELGYVQPDGEFAYVAMDPMFGNNTTVPLKDMTVTDAQLIAFVTDPELNLPPLTKDQQAEENKLKNYAPTPAQIEAAAKAKLSGSLQRGRVNDDQGQLTVVENWTEGSSTAQIELSVTASPLVMPCTDALSTKTCEPVTLPGGGKGEYGEGPRDYQGGSLYVMGATYLQPDGDLASVRVTYPGTKLPAGHLSKDQILALVADPALDQ